MQEGKQDQKVYYEWVKASDDTPPESDLISMHLKHGGPCLGRYNKTHDFIHVEKYGKMLREEFPNVEWLKPVTKDHIPEAGKMVPNLVEPNYKEIVKNLNPLERELVAKTFDIITGFFHHTFSKVSVIDVKNQNEFSEYCERLSVAIFRIYFPEKLN